MLHDRTGTAFSNDLFDFSEEEEAGAEEMAAAAAAARSLATPTSARSCRRALQGAAAAAAGGRPLLVVEGARFLGLAVGYEVWGRVGATEFRRRAPIKSARPAMHVALRHSNTNRHSPRPPSGHALSHSEPRR